MTVNTVARPRGYPGYSETMRCAPESAEGARSLVRTALAVWGLSHLANGGVVVVTELVANAAQHTQSPSIRVSVSRPADDLVQIAVVDRSRLVPVLGDPDVDGTRGRGLALVEALTDRWGTDPLPWGKRVWGELKESSPPGPIEK
jgi:serine/threonine-protein kinase RsbW